MNRPIATMFFHCLTLLASSPLQQTSWNEVMQAGIAQRNAGRLAEAEVLFQRALDVTQQGADGDIHRAASWNHLGGIKQMRGDYVAALSLYKNSIRIYEECPIASPSILEVLSNQALALRHLGRLQESAATVRKALALQRATFGHEGTSGVLIHVSSWLAADEGRFDDARKGFEEELRILGQQRAGGAQVAAVLGSLAHICYKQGNYARSEAHYRRSLELRRKFLPADSLEIYRTMTSLAAVLTESSHYERAERLLRQSIKGMESAPLIHPSEVSAPLANLALLLAERRKFVEAEQHARRALALQEQHNRSLSAGTLGTRLTLAMILVHSKRETEAENILREALASHETLKGSSHSDLVRILQNLAVLMTWQKRYLDAEPLFLRAISIAETSLGSKHQDLAQVLASYSLLLKATNRKLEATAARKRAEAIGAEARVDLAGALAVDYRELKK